MLRAVRWDDRFLDMSNKTRRSELIRRRLGAFEYGVRLCRALAMWAHEEMRDDRGRLVREQFGAEPLHLDMTVRADRRFKLLRSASETINHAASQPFLKA
ncbi:hypothetical protein [Bradyrhizobium genosp. SA-3]|uniref:hypothetical protein n=1 Tax=Bradyrhizobium genosp. SA-3 TaxID=508868 RepID=UPI0013EEE744|nr:hypothetical protein [Bradyrhizobium genosp. SA-3]